MKSIARIASAALAVILLGGTAYAAEQTVKLDVQNVTCASCAPIVKRVLARVPGVSQVSVSERGPTVTATVTFEDALTTVPELVEATTNAGFPSKPARSS